jgi:phosphatidylinositol alpha-1,6-mannosyltransferase
MTTAARTGMRIAFYSPRSTHMEHALAHGGDPIFLEALFGALRERGHEVEVASRLNVRDLWRRRLPTHRVLSEAIAIKRRMKRFSPNAWLIFNPSPTYPDLFGWWQRAPRYVLFSAHTWQSKRLPKAWRRPLALAFARSLAQADAVVTPRPATAIRLRARGVPPDRLHVHPVATTLPTDIPSQGDARRRFGLPTEAPVMLCTTRFTGPREAKEGKTEMILNLLELMPSLPESAVLVLVGDGPGRARIEAKAASIAPPGRVRIFGPVKSEELALFHGASDFYVYPHPLDRTWLSVLEAQAHGRAVVTMRTQSGEMTVDAGMTGLLANDIHEFRALVAGLLGDRDRCAAMGRAARRYIQRNHAIDVRAEQIEALLASS